MFSDNRDVINSRPTAKRKLAAYESALAEKQAICLSRREQIRDWCLIGLLMVLGGLLGLLLGWALSELLFPARSSVSIPTREVRYSYDANGDCVRVEVR